LKEIAKTRPIFGISRATMHIRYQALWTRVKLSRRLPFLPYWRIS
jgi:hypothetical protein